ncbi:MAG: copper chaperone PCu(A)C [Dokdonella sp.]
MNIAKRSFSMIALTMCVAIAPAFAADKLEIRDAWIRSAPPSAMMLAGYATLHNAGDAPITVSAVKAEGFDETSLHETVMVGDVSQMRAIGDLVIAPGASVAFAPGGKHIMLMQPTKSPKPGDHVAITFSFADGGKQSADFVIRDAAPDDETAMPVTHDH